MTVETGGALARPVVLLDFDGTMVNTAPGIMKTVKRVLGDHGLSREDMGDLRRFVGPPLIDSFEGLYGFSHEQAVAIVDEYRVYYNQLPSSEYPLFDGVRELVADLLDAGRKVAVATSRLESRTVEMLRALDMNHIDVVRGLNPPGRLTKADSIRDALRAFAASPADAVMVGDTPFDVAGAHEMGLPCVGVTHGGAASPYALAEAGADAVCPDVPALRRVLGLDR